MVQRPLNRTFLWDLFWRRIGSLDASTRRVHAVRFCDEGVATPLRRRSRALWKTGGSIDSGQSPVSALCFLFYYPADSSVPRGIFSDTYATNEKAFTAETQDTKIRAISVDAEAVPRRLATRNTRSTNDLRFSRILVLLVSRSGALQSSPRRDHEIGDAGSESGRGNSTRACQHGFKKRNCYGARCS